LADEIAAQIRTYIDYVTAHPDADDEVIADTLTQSGLEQFRAFELLIWVPMAFGRAVLEGPDFRLPASFQLMSSDGQKMTRRRLADEPVYVEARRIAIAFARGNFSKSNFVAIAGRSAEFKAVNDALQHGSELKNLQPAEPVITFPDQVPPQRKPWWKFW
jgi:hypothetical protein